jgi:hypothetical protein
MVFLRRNVVARQHGIEAFVNMSPMMGTHEHHQASPRPWPS